MMNLMNYATTRRMESEHKHFCVSWWPDGESLVIDDIKNFTNDVIPKFFKATKFDSFVRKCEYSARWVSFGIEVD